MGFGTGPGWGWAGRQRTELWSGPWLVKDTRLGGAAATPTGHYGLQIHFFFFFFKTNPFFTKLGVAYLSSPSSWILGPKLKMKSEPKSVAQVRGRSRHAGERI